MEARVFFFPVQKFLYQTSILDYEQATSLCLQSQQFVSDCLRHLTFVAAQDVPPATSIHKSDWTLYRRVAEIENYWKIEIPYF